MAGVSSGAPPVSKWNPQAPETPSSKHGHGQSPAAPATPTRASTMSSASVNAPLVASSAATKLRASAAVAAGAAAASAAGSRATAAAAKATAASRSASQLEAINLPGGSLVQTSAGAGGTARVPMPASASAALAAVASKLANLPLTVAVAPVYDDSVFPDGTPKGPTLDMQPATPDKTVPPLIMQLNSPITRSPTSRRPLGSRRMSVSTLSPEAMLAEAMKLLPPREGSADARVPLYASSRASAAQLAELAKEAEAAAAAGILPVAPVIKMESTEQAQRRHESEMGIWANSLKAAAATSGIDSGLEHLLKKPNAFLVTVPKRPSDDPEGFPSSTDPAVIITRQSPSQRPLHSSYKITLPKPTSVIVQARIIDALPPTNSINNIINNSKGVIAFINSHVAASANSAAMTPTMAATIGLAEPPAGGGGEITPRTVDFNRVSNLLHRMTTRVSRGTDLDPVALSQEPPSLSHNTPPAMQTSMIRSNDPRDAPRAPRGAAPRQYNTKDNSFMNLQGATPGLPAVMNNKGQRGSLLCLSRDGHPYSEAVFHTEMDSIRRAGSDGVQPGTLTASPSFSSLPPLDDKGRLPQRRISMARYDTTNAKEKSLAMGIFRAKARESSDTADSRTSFGGAADFGGGMDYYGVDYAGGGTRNLSASGSAVSAEDGRTTPSKGMSMLQVMPVADHHLIQKPTHTRLPAPVGVSRQRRGSVLF